jgi:glutathione S-transferase
MFDIDLAKEFPHVDAWLNRQKARPSVETALKARADAIAAL